MNNNKNIENYYEVATEFCHEEVWVGTVNLNRYSEGRIRYDDSVPTVYLLHQDDLEDFLSIVEYQISTDHCGNDLYVVKYNDQLVDAIYKFEDHSHKFLTEEELMNRHKINKDYIEREKRFTNLYKALEGISKDLQDFEKEMDLSNEDRNREIYDHLDLYEISPELLMQVWEKSRAKNFLDASREEKKDHIRKKISFLTDEADLDVVNEKINRLIEEVRSDK